MLGCNERRRPTLRAEQSRPQPEPESAAGEPGANQPQTQRGPGTVRDAGLSEGSRRRAGVGGRPSPALLAPACLGSHPQRRTVCHRGSARNWFPRPDGSSHHLMLTHLPRGPTRPALPEGNRVGDAGSGTAKAQPWKPLAVQDARACGGQWPASQPAAAWSRDGAPPRI